MIWKIVTRLIIITKRVYQTKGLEGESLPSKRENITPRVVPVATGRAFKEQERKQELNKKPCLIQLRELIACEKAKHQAKLDEYNALRAQGLRRDPVRASNLVSVLEIILEVNEEDENILMEQNAVKSTQMELSFLHIKTRHSFHLVDSSPWPIIAFLGVFMLTARSVLYMQKFISSKPSVIFLDGPCLWQRAFEETTVFSNKHSSFFFIVIMFITLWFFICIFYYFVLCDNRDKLVVQYKELKIIRAWLVLFLIALPLFVFWEFDIVTTALEPELPQNDLPVNPLWGPPTEANADMLHEVALLLKDMQSLGYSKDLVLLILHSRTPDEFWELEYSQKRYCLQKYFEALQKQEEKQQAIVAIAFFVCITTLIVGILWVYPR
jgi:hypothetical protein